MKSKKLETLVQLSNMLLDAEQAKLSKAAAQCQSTRSKLSGLDVAVQRQNDVIAAELEAPVAGTVLDCWGAWAERQRFTLNTELAQQIAALEEQRQLARTAFGRAEALRGLQTQERLKALQKEKSKARRSNA